MNISRKLSTLVMVAILALPILVGCDGCHKSTLEGGGAYSPGVTASVTNADNTVTSIFTPSQRPDKELFLTDSAFGIAYSAIDTIFTLEKQNRGWLWNVSPEIKKTLDQVRPQAADAVRKYTQARKLYIANPTAAGLTNLQTILAEAQRLATSVQAVIPANTPTTSPAPAPAAPVPQ